MKKSSRFVRFFYQLTLKIIIGIVAFLWLVSVFGIFLLDEQSNHHEVVTMFIVLSLLFPCFWYMLKFSKNTSNDLKDNETEKCEDPLDHSSLSKTQIVIYTLLTIGAVYWLASGDLEDAGLVSADKPDVVMQRPADDQDDIHYMLITVAANQAAADAAYQKGVDALILKQSGMIASMERAAGEVDRGVISMANAKEEKTKTIANVKARQDMRDGLHILWQINTVRRNWLQEYATAIKSGSEPAMLAVARKYKEVMPSLAPAALKALEKFRAAKSDVGLGNNLREFSQ